jgi:hypothetical protein
MNDTPDSARPTREQLRQQFLGQAATAFDLMFAPDHAEQLVTFDQREQRALELGQQLLLALLQRHANADPAADPPPGPPPLCPRCQRPGRRASPADDPLPARTLTTSAGDVTLRRARFRRTACRAVFFPPR